MYIFLIAGSLVGAEFHDITISWYYVYLNINADLVVCSVVLS